MEFTNNKVYLSGTIVGNFEFSHEVFGEKFFNVPVDTERISGNIDRIVVTVSERLVDCKKDWSGKNVIISGQFRSHNKYDGEKSHLILSVFANELNFAEKTTDASDIWLDGFICRNPIYRKTPLGREITDILLAVNRPYGRTDYIPCIVWGRNARFAKSLDVGTKIELSGRIQSRTYIKQIDGIEETKTAFEVSVSMLQVANIENQKQMKLLV